MTRMAASSSTTSSASSRSRRISIRFATSLVGRGVCWRTTIEGPDDTIPTISMRTVGKSFCAISAGTSNYSSMTIDERRAGINRSVFIYDFEHRPKRPRLQTCCNQTAQVLCRDHLARAPIMAVAINTKAFGCVLPGEFFPHRLNLNIAVSYFQRRRER